MSDLDRLLELYFIESPNKFSEEYKTLKAKFEDLQQNNDQLLEQVKRELKDNNALRITATKYFKLTQTINEMITTESPKQVGSCDQHDTGSCPDCEKWFLLQELKEYL